MTFKRFEQLFLQKYPDGHVWMHGEFERGARGRVQKIGVEFKPDSKVYLFRGAYEDILNRVGIKVISKERFAELEMRLKRLRETNGTKDFFGGIVDNTQEIKRYESAIAEKKADYIIV